MPSSDKLYTITGLEWKNGAAVSGNIIAGVDMINANPPTIASTPLIAYSQEVAQSGTNAVQRVSNIASNMIRASTLCGAWVSIDNTTGRLREITGQGSQNQQKATSYSNTLNAVENTAWSTATVRIYLKVYYIAYS